MIHLGGKSDEIPGHVAQALKMAAATPAENLARPGTDVAPKHFPE
jgi:hypothetical protein